MLCGIAIGIINTGIVTETMICLGLQINDASTFDSTIAKK